MRRVAMIVLVLVALIGLGVYLYPGPQQTFEEVYARTPTEKSAALLAFRAAYPPSALIVDGVSWEFIRAGEGPETILFLHGMTGSADIWWQQIEALKADYHILAVTYPAVDTLEDLEKGVLAILDQAGVEKFNLVGSSLGGYFAQYLVARHPDRILKAVFANTFPPNDLIAEKNGTIGMLLPFLPEWLVMNVLRGSFQSSVYPASGNDELTLAFLNEISYGRMSKAQVVGRYRCVVEKFQAPDLSSGAIPVLIIEADNDPLVEEALRVQLRAAYPSANVLTVRNGHFPYLATPEVYTGQLQAFFAGR